LDAELTRPKENITLYLLGLMAKDNQPRKTPIKIDTINFGVFEKVSPVGKIKLSANAILMTIPKKPAYFETASFISWVTGKNISSILSLIRLY
jgi:hypothetical protein